MTETDVKLLSRRQAVFSFGVMSALCVASHQAAQKFTFPVESIAQRLIRKPPSMVPTSVHWAELWTRSAGLNSALPLSSLFRPEGLDAATVKADLVDRSQAVEPPMVFAVTLPRTPSPNPSAGIPNVIQAAIKIGARTSGLSPGFMATVAWLESRFVPNASHDGDATGLYQFQAPTWLSTTYLDAPLLPTRYRQVAMRLLRQSDGTYSALNQRDIADILSWRVIPSISAIAAGAEMTNNGAALQSMFGRPATQTDLYLSHCLGLTGASDFIRAADNGDPIPSAVIGGNGPILNGPTATFAYNKLSQVINSKTKEYNHLV